MNAENPVVECEAEGLIILCKNEVRKEKSPHPEIGGICASVDCYVDGEKVRTANFHFDKFKYCRNPVLFKCEAKTAGKHKIRLELKNPHPKFEPLTLSIHGFKTR